MGFRGCVPWWLLGLIGELVGLPWGFRSDSPPSYENSRIPSLWRNRFLASLQKIRFKGILRGFIWVYRVCVWVWLSCGFRVACGALCV